MSEKSQVLSHLSEEFLYPIRDPLWRHIYLSHPIKSVVASTPFQKLSGIRQLGPAYLVYPGATHTRFNHSLGVFELSKRTLMALLHFDATDCVTLEGAKAFLCAALLHDLGHFPYAHSLKELPLKEHEQLTAELVRDTELSTLIKEEVGTDPDFVAAVVDLTADFPEEAELTCYRRILSGVLDPDKLDYLNRDAFFCGVPYGMQDIDFVLSKLRYDRTFGIFLDRDGVNAVENVLFSKYLMYRTVYWHRSVRAATAMIKSAILPAIQQKFIAPEDLYGLDDEDFARRYAAPGFPQADLVQAVSHRRLYGLALEIPVNHLSTVAGSALSIEHRPILESRLADLMGTRYSSGGSPPRVIVDLPEPISFEADLSIETPRGLVAFPQSGTVFDGTVVSGFSRSLRKLRVFVKEVSAELRRDMPRLLEEASSGLDKEPRDSCRNTGQA